MNTILHITKSEQWTQLPLREGDCALSAQACAITVWLSKPNPYDWRSTSIAVIRANRLFI
ncbi:hypothetical protein [Nostoc commune]|uniref:hypothetical protein n=1 Tax=Nostoc commune TaxID=1178 RepID=UPI00207404E5|nr:hypothetical protein [Nostoc commune]